MAETPAGMPDIQRALRSPGWTYSELPWILRSGASARLGKQPDQPAWGLEKQRDRPIF